jgi:hypothetical protein
MKWNINKYLLIFCALAVFGPILGAVFGVADGDSSAASGIALGVANLVYSFYLFCIIWAVRGVMYLYKKYN